MYKSLHSTTPGHLTAEQNVIQFITSDLFIVLCQLLFSGGVCDWGDIRQNDKIVSFYGTKSFQSWTKKMLFIFKDLHVPPCHLLFSCGEVFRVMLEKMFKSSHSPDSHLKAEEKDAVSFFFSALVFLHVFSMVIFSWNFILSEAEKENINFQCSKHFCLAFYLLFSRYNNFFLKLYFYPKLNIKRNNIFPVGSVFFCLAHFSCFLVQNILLQYIFVMHVPQWGGWGLYNLPYVLSLFFFTAKAAAQGK